MSIYVFSSIENLYEPSELYLGSKNKKRLTLGFDETLNSVESHSKLVKYRKRAQSSK